MIRYWTYLQKTNFSCQSISIEREEAQEARVFFFLTLKGQNICRSETADCRKDLGSRNYQIQNSLQKGPHDNLLLCLRTLQVDYMPQTCPLMAVVDNIYIVSPYSSIQYSRICIYKCTLAQEHMLLSLYDE